MTFSGAAIVAGVAGWPIKHSRSPRIHNYWLRKYEIDGVYVPFAIDPDGGRYTVAWETDTSVALWTAPLP